MNNVVLSGNQYGYRPVRSTADILNVITYRISEASDNTSITKTIVLDISKAFDSESCYGISEMALPYK